jgi:AraC family transcriptional regulator, transcriptional activator of pobA
VLFTSPGQVRRWDVDRMPAGYALIFEEEFLCSFFNDSAFVHNLSYFGDFSSHGSFVLSAEEYDQLMVLLKNIYIEICQPKLKDKHVLRALLYQALMILNRMFLSRYPVSQTNRNNRHVQMFSHLVNSFYRNNRSVGLYAEQLNITPSHLNDLVKQHLGVSAKHYILNRTLLEAKRLLNYTGQSVDEIAQYLNFDNSSYFIRLFRKHTGKTPLQYRNLQIRKK